MATGIIYYCILYIILLLFCIAYILFGTILFLTVYIHLWSAPLAYVCLWLWVAVGGCGWLGGATTISQLFPPCNPR